MLAAVVQAVIPKSAENATQSGRNHVVSNSTENDSMEIFEKIFTSLFDGITSIYVAVGRLIESRELMHFAV